VYVKENWEGSPYCVANEYICGTIGRFLGLPIPPCDVLRLPGKRYAFAALDFNYDRERMPPVLPDLVVRHQPLLSTGILLYDILIANNDRHDENLVTDNVSAPRQILVFDHDQALFGGGGPVRGRERLETLQGRLGIGVAGGVTGGTGHCLLPYVTTAEHFGFWVDRIRGIPRWLFVDACGRAAETGIGKRDAARAAKFLYYRSRHLEDMITSERNSFTSITTWPKFGGLFP